MDQGDSRKSLGLSNFGLFDLSLNNNNFEPAMWHVHSALTCFYYNAVSALCESMKMMSYFLLFSFLSFTEYKRLGQIHIKISMIM